ncbi:class I SAM-dependent methyltransferase [Actinomycetospora straminea]|uniref:Methyltransferase domain-containing protein n=1 Tax=Actinomycetospora straminea TaxID=663607 RepID=A0ABP9ENU1_9PSEU|nr:class I SAM-dependent methyltransferase [Actinomycetospora straminea]MDD7935033.1 class I SAM-dependent methyltransferase [Actinomycetospora straminea]
MSAAAVPSEGHLRSDLRSPGNGEALRADTPHSLDDGTARWPVLEGIPYLRAGREEVRDSALAALDDGRPDDAAAVLLADNDDWWDQPPPPADQLRATLGATTLREAVAGLGLGRVGDYFLHRDHDPSGLAVLALTAAHPPAGRPVLDLACGAGHLLRRLADHGERDLTGVDVVFAKLWLARRFLVPEHVALVCADLAHPWPVPPRTDTWVAVHDVLYFLEDPAAVLATATRHAGDRGAVVAAHCHNLGQPGHPRPPEAWAALLPGATTYAEEELTSATLERRLPRAADAQDLGDTEAVALARDGGDVPAAPALLDPPEGADLRPNPLYADGERRWPDEVWGDEYGPRAATYLPERWPDPLPADATARRLVVDLPERW